MNELTLLRIQTGQTRAQFADFMGVTERTVKRWETYTPPRYAIAAARALGGYIEHPNWDNWKLWQGKLHSPNNVAFEPCHLLAFPYIEQELALVKTQLSRHHIAMNNLSLAPKY